MNTSFADHSKHLSEFKIATLADLGLINSSTILRALICASGWLKTYRILDEKFPGSNPHKLTALRTPRRTDSHRIACINHIRAF